MSGSWRLMPPRIARVTVVHLVQGLGAGDLSWGVDIDDDEVTGIDVEA